MQRLTAIKADTARLLRAMPKDNAPATTDDIENVLKVVLRLAHEVQLVATKLEKL